MFNGKMAAEGPPKYVELNGTSYKNEPDFPFEILRMR